jgi:predicted TIM-barrel fold metal-dependent hydrolase
MAASNGVRAIDTHAHIFLRDLPMASGRRYAPDYDAPLPTYLKTLGAHGIDYGVLIQPSFLGTDNSYMMAALEAHPDRLRGFAVVPIDVDIATLQSLKRAGVMGVRLNLIGKPTPDFAAADWKTHLDRLAALGWMVEVQVEAARLPKVAPGIAAAGLRLIVDHFGRPDAALGIDDPGFRYLLDLGRHGNVWVKLSGAYRLAPGQAGEALAAQAASALLHNFGAHRLMWGSDWPHTQFETVASYGRARALLDRWVPDVRDRHRVLVDTPTSLFGFPSFVQGPIDAQGAMKHSGQ